MKYLYDKSKNERLKKERSVSFEEIIALLEAGRLIGMKPHSNPEKYPNQSMLEIDIDGYMWLVPCIKEKNRIVLKTAYPSRKATKKRKDDI